MEHQFQLEEIFPLYIRERLSGENWQEGLEEIRVRIGGPLEFSYDTKIRYLALEGETCRFAPWDMLYQGKTEPYRVRMTDIAEMLNYISNYSLYAYKEEMKQGYITIEGGHRIGLAGGAVTECGKIKGLHHVSFLNIRVAHERRGCAREILPFLRQGESIYNTLFLSVPGAGKTTYLRDTVRLLSEGNEGHSGMKICVVDERSELAACHMGMPQNDLGPRTDVLDGCGKAEGMLLLLRAMSPQILAVDELGGEEDFAAVEQAVYSGSRVLGTIHAGSTVELSEKPYLRRWIEKEVFGRYVLITRNPDGTRSAELYDAHLKRIDKTKVG